MNTVYFIDEEDVRRVLDTVMDFRMEKEILGEVITIDDIAWLLSLPEEVVKFIVVKIYMWHSPWMRVRGFDILGDNCILANFYVPFNVRWTEVGEVSFGQTVEDWVRFNEDFVRYVEVSNE